MPLKFLKKFKSVNNYITKNWTKEETYKYLFEYNDKYIEAGYFIHFKNKKIIKKVIELSTSYGCPFKCKHCASSTINEFEILEPSIVLEVLDYIIKDNNIRNDEKIVVPLTGIGDLFFTSKEATDFINKASIKYPNIIFDISTILLNERILKDLEKIDKSRIRYLQLTYISDTKIRNVVNIPQEISYSFSEILKLIQDEPYKIRINYILIKNLNDSEDDFIKFRDSLIKFKNRVKVRISRVNETAASINNNLKCGSIKNMQRLSELLSEKNIENYIFYSKKNDNMNCGQLIYQVKGEWQYDNRIWNYGANEKRKY